jgi:hypothetical protein
LDKAQLSILKAQVSNQVEAIENLFEKVEVRKNPQSSAEWESLAFRLHNLYCAFEDLFKIVAGFFENQLDDKSKYHMELLKRMMIEIEGIRPALLNPRTVRLLDNLRAFRHFFRWAYTAELDKRKLCLVLDDALELRKIYRQDVFQFLKKLIGLLSEE